MQPENGGGPPGVRRDPVGGVGASRHQDIWNRAEDAEIQVVSPLPAILAPQDSAKPWPDEPTAVPQPGRPLRPVRQRDCT